MVTAPYYFQSRCHFSHADVFASWDTPMFVEPAISCWKPDARCMHLHGSFGGGILGVRGGLSLRYAHAVALSRVATMAGFPGFIPGQCCRHKGTTPKDKTEAPRRINRINQKLAPVLAN